MKLFKKNKSSSRFGGGGKKFGGKPSKKRGFGDRNDRDSGGRKPWENGSQMHETTCDECGNRAEVPFKPNGSRPVLCRDCFRKDDDAPRGKFDRDREKKRGFDRPKSGDKRSFVRGPKRNDSGDRRLDEMNAKLDRILREIAELKEGQI